MTRSSAAGELGRYRPWFYAAAAYNLLWGSAIVLFPVQSFACLGLPPPTPVAIWQVVGMLVAVYAPAYWWAGRDPWRHRHFIVIGLLGKVLGPLGFLWSAWQGGLPWSFGWVNLTNDLIWWPSFALFLRGAAARGGGWNVLLRGE
jgi:small multidrug resistance pump